MLISYKLGQGSIILRIKILDSAATTGAGKTGLTSASTGLIISTIANNEATATAYTVAAGNVETITTLGTYQSPTSGKCRFKEVDATNHKGVYEIHIADARFAVSSAKSILVSISGATDAAECDALIPLVQLDPYEAMRGTDGANTTAPDNTQGAAVITALGTGTWATAIPWNAAWDEEVQSEVQDAIEVNHLDHLLAADYDPASKPGVATALLNELIGNDGGVSQFSANALEMGPGGSTAAAIAAAMFTADTGSTYATAVAGSVVKEIADNAGVGAITNVVTISASAPSLTAINSGGTITIHRGDLTSFQLTDLGSLAGRTGEKIYFTVKAAEYTAASVDDTVATIQVTETTGATRLNGEATTASYGSITVDDETDGDITIALQHQLTTALPVADGYYYDVQMINSAGKPVTLTRGLLNVDADVTRGTT